MSEYLLEGCESGVPYVIDNEGTRMHPASIVPLLNSVSKLQGEIAAMRKVVEAADMATAMPCVEHQRALERALSEYQKVREP